MQSRLWYTIAALGLVACFALGVAGLFAVARVYRREVSRGAGRLMACVSTAVAGVGLAIVLAAFFVAYILAIETLSILMIPN